MTMMYNSFVSPSYLHLKPIYAKLNFALKVENHLFLKRKLGKNFKENKKLFNRVVDRTKKNIKLTDPRYVQQRYDELRGTNQKKKNEKELKNMKLKLKLKKHLPQYESKGVFKHVDSDDFKRNIK